MIKMQSRAGKDLRSMVLGAVGVLFLLQAGCTSTHEQTLVRPNQLRSPYGSSGDVLWAVLPPANESGASAVDTLAIGDALVAAVTETDGLACKPLNATLEAMRAMKISQVRTPTEARQLTRAMGVDGLLVSTVTAYDPYDPPVLGMSVALYTDGATGPRRRVQDPSRLEGAATDGQWQATFESRPASVVTEHLSAASHDIQLDVQNYAHGRHPAESALGWRRYLKSMDLYSQFAAHRLVGAILDRERARLGEEGAAVASGPEAGEDAKGR